MYFRSWIHDWSRNCPPRKLRHPQTTSSERASKVADLRPFAFKDIAMYAPFDHRIRRRIGLTFLIVLLLVGFAATLGLVHKP